MLKIQSEKDSPRRKLGGRTLAPPHPGGTPPPTQATRVSSTLLRFASQRKVNVTSKEYTQKLLNAHTPQGGGFPPLSVIVEHPGRFV